MNLYVLIAALKWHPDKVMSKSTDSNGRAASPLLQFESNARFKRIQEVRVGEGVETRKLAWLWAWHGILKGVKR